MTGLLDKLGDTRRNVRDNGAERWRINFGNGARRRISALSRLKT